MQALITVSKLEHPEHAGDWHDKPLRWIVNGPDTECQKFQTKKNALLYKRLRARSNSAFEAGRWYSEVAE
jgi:hypothetical protein